MRLRRRSITSLSLLAPIALAVGCSSSLELGLPPVHVDRRLGEQTAELVATEMGLVDDVATTRYLNEVGRRVVARIPKQRFDYEFRVIDQPEPNAFAAPGGYVFVSRGMLALCNDEDELATVLAHEIVHVSRRHTVKQIAQDQMPNLFALPGQALETIAGDDVGAALGSPFTNLSRGWKASFSRDHEYEADRIGQMLAADAGYDPLALGPLLERMEHIALLRTGEPSMPSFFDTHPSTPDRSMRLTQHGNELEPAAAAPIAPNSRAFLRRMEGLLIGPNPLYGVVRGTRFLHPGLGYVLDMPESWSIVKTPFTVGAVAPEHDGVAFLVVQGEARDLEAAGEAFLEDLAESVEMTPTRKEMIDIDGRSAYLVSFEVEGDDEPGHVNLLWLEHEGLLFQALSVGRASHDETLLAALTSFRPIEDDERRSIRQLRLRLATAQEDETLMQFGARMRSVFGEEALAVLNGIEDDEAPLEPGRLVKYVASEPLPRIIRWP